MRLGGKTPSAFPMPLSMQVCSAPASPLGSDNALSPVRFQERATCTTRGRRLCPSGDLPGGIRLRESASRRALILQRLRLRHRAAAPVVRRMNAVSSKRSTTKAVWRTGHADDAPPPRAWEGPHATRSPARAPTVIGQPRPVPSSASQKVSSNQKRECRHLTEWGRQLLRRRRFGKCGHHLQRRTRRVSSQSPRQSTPLLKGRLWKSRFPELFMCDHFRDGTATCRSGKCHS